MKKLSKILVVISFLFILVGCGNMMATPTKKVEEFLSKYQNQDKEVLDQLDSVITDADMTDSQKEDYYDLMKKQYKNLSYKIKDETEDGDTATVVVEVEVLDYGSSISESEKYLASNKEEFMSETEKDAIDMVKFLTYKIKQMADVKDKVTYTINFSLTKNDKEWKINDISDIDRLKLHGLYY